MRCVSSAQVLARIHQKGALQWSLCRERLGNHKQRWSGSPCPCRRALQCVRYCGIVDDVLLPYVYDSPFNDGCFLLQHDRIPIHKARCVIQLLDDSQVPQLE
ncbi:hypothetical protein HPB48_002465 [Haemaphysalis longicornis]|uniref:Uncharacterized protein n=1 Tax=Haemaphysalis longicornis TaxID=44386 RepID=A0A9J6FL56_HAELO|nr:hypothetical protein HPB48_002465 [Haemaphysalis longicornis]